MLIIAQIVISLILIGLILIQETPRGLLEAAKSFVKDAANIKNPTALFLWKLTELKKEARKNKPKRDK